MANSPTVDLGYFDESRSADVVNARMAGPGNERLRVVIGAIVLAKREL